MIKVQRLSGLSRSNGGLEIMQEINTTEKAIERAKLLEVEILRSLRINGNTTVREIKCGKCNNTSQVQDQTFTRWVKAGKKHCSICNGATKGIPAEVKVQQLNNALPELYKTKVEVIEYLGYDSAKSHGYCLVLFKECKHTKKYCCATLKQISKQGKALKCDTCPSSNTSVMEQWSNQVLPTWLEKQVPYACIANTSRRWIADYYDSITNTIIEVTTSGQQQANEYSVNMQEKKEWCMENSIALIVVNNINSLKDIVRSLEKSRGVTGNE